MLNNRLMAVPVAVVLVMAFLAQAIEGASFMQHTGNKRNGQSATELAECMDGNGMDRQLRSGGDGLNYYLFNLAKCVSHVGRPRFGKRSSSSPMTQLMDRMNYEDEPDIIRDLAVANAHKELVEEYLNRRIFNKQ